MDVKDRLDRRRIVNLLTGESGVGKSYIFSQLSSLSVTKIDFDSVKSDQGAALRKAIEIGKPVVASITRGVSTIISRNSNYFVFRIFLIDSSVETILAQRKQRAEAKGKVYNKPGAEDKIAARLRRLTSIFSRYGSENFRGSQEEVLAAINKSVSGENFGGVTALQPKDFYVYEVAVIDQFGVESVVYVGKGSKSRKDSRFDPSEVYLQERMAEAVDCGHTWQPRIVDDFVNLTESEAYSFEVEWLAHRRAEGHSCLNRNTGGLGGWTHNAETRAKISQRTVAACGSPDYRLWLANRMAEVMSRPGYLDQIRKSISARNATPEWKANQSAKMTGKILGPASEERKEKIRQAHLGVPESDETKSILSEAHKGLACPESTKQKLSEYWAGKPKSSEHCEAIRKAKLGKPRDEATKEKIRLTLAGRKCPRRKTRLTYDEWEWMFIDVRQTAAPEFDPAGEVLTDLERYKLQRARHLLKSKILQPAPAA